MIRSYFGGSIPEAEAENENDRKLRLGFDELKEKVFRWNEDYSWNRALEEIWRYLNSVNKYLAEAEPWKLSKDRTCRARLGRILLQAAAAIRGIAYLLYPVMPESSDKIWRMMDEEKSIADVLFRKFEFNGLGPGRQIREPAPLFPRVPLKEFLSEEIPGASPKKEEKMDMISYEEFKKMDLRTALIVKAEKVPGTDKLLRIEIDLGTEKRTMVAGVADTYSPEELIGKKLVVIANLKPAVIRGIESQAMLLAAEVGGKAIIPFFERDVPAGAKVK
jgi:methionyl-tRNA synthetase